MQPDNDNPDAVQPTAETTPLNSAQPEPIANVVPQNPAGVPAPTASPKKRKKLWLLLAGVGIFVLLGAGSAAAYFGIILPNSPQRIAQQALSNSLNSEKIQSSYFEGEVNLEGGDVSKSISGLTFNGATGQNGAVDLTASLNSALTKITLNAKSQDGKTLYLKLSGLKGLDKLLGSLAGGSEAPDQTAAVAGLIGSLNDTWVMIDQSLLKGISPQASDVTNTKMSAEDAQKVGDIYKKHQFLSIDKKLGDQDIHGMKSYHIQATINKDQLIAFMNELKSANIPNLTVEQSTIDQLNKVDFSKYPFDLWVSHKDRLITQIAGNFTESGTTYKVRIALFDFNKPVTVEKPADAKSLLELLGALAPFTSGLQGGGTASDLPLNL